MSAHREPFLVDLLRHGEPEGGDLFRGASIDHALSGRGWAQMRAVLDGGPGWVRVVSSPLRRCLEFAREAARNSGTVEAVDDDLAEISFGRWEGMRPADIEAATPGALARYRDDPLRYPPPEGEDLAAFATRVDRAWQRISAGPAVPTLVVAHGGIIRVILARVLDMPLSAIARIETPYACLTRLRVAADPGDPAATLAAHGTRDR